jgi:hypothetical protein
MKSDSQLIDDLGGPARVAERLGYDKLGGVQRVQNWKTRGIPPKVKLEHPDLFLRGLTAQQPPAGDAAAAEVQQAA